MKAAESIGNYNAKIELDEIMEIVSNVTNISCESIRSKSRKKEIVKARHLFSFFAADYQFVKTNVSKMLNEDHSTTLSAIKKIESDLKIYASNPDYSTMILIRKIDEEIECLILEKLIFAMTDYERRMSDAS